MNTNTIQKQIQIQMEIQNIMKHWYPLPAKGAMLELPSGSLGGQSRWAPTTLVVLQPNLLSQVLIHTLYLYLYVYKYKYSFCTNTATNGNTNMDRAVGWAPTTLLLQPIVPYLSQVQIHLAVFNYSLKFLKGYWATHDCD